MSVLDLLSGGLPEPAECVVELEGNGLAELYALLAEVRVESSRGQADVCVLRFESHRDMDGNWVVQDHADIRPWSELTVEAQFGSRSEPVFAGYIKEVRTAYPRDRGAAEVTVYAQDESLLLDRQSVIRRRSTAEEPKTDKEAVEAAITEVSSLSLDPDSEDGLTNEALVQSGTAATFIRERAQANGYEFYVREGSVYFGPPRLDGEPRPTILVYAGPRTNCVDFRANFDGHLPDAVRIHRPGEDGAEGEELIVEPDLDELGDESASSADRGLEPYVMTLAPTGATPAEMEAAAQARANQYAWKLRAQGELDGDIYGDVLRTYEVVLVDGAGSTYSGTWYVDAVRHSFTATGYRQHFRLIRNATGDGALA